MSKGKRRRRHLAGGGAILLAALCTLPAPALAALPDNRGWELVSPVDKNGGRVDPPETVNGGGDYQAAAQGGQITYSSATSFGADATGASPASQYLAIRTASGWAAQNITVATLSGAYAPGEGSPYRLFSGDLARGLLFNGDHCRGGAEGCAVANPPLAGTEAPEGYQDYYVREGSSFTALLTSSQIAGRELDPATFDLRLEGTSADLRAAVLASCAALTATAIDGCATNAANLYLWKQSTGTLSLLNELPGVQLAAQAGAVAPEGARVYFQGAEGGPLQLREGNAVYPVALTAAFQAASADGSLAFYTEGSHLYRYATATHSSTDLTPAGGVVGVLGASASGNAVYYQDGSGLKRFSEGTTTTVASGAAAAAPSDSPPASGTARVSEDGTKLLFETRSQLTPYNNTDKYTAQPDTELYLYDSGGPTLKCISCNPRGTRPIGSSWVPGAYANGSFAAYKPRALSADGKRVLFTSADALVAADSNSNATTHAGIEDAYQWEAQGEGSCTAAAGCTSILSNGALPQGASFLDASADGSDAYFLTEQSLVGADPGSGDLYDARVGGGYPEPPPQIPCEGDACQVLPAVPSEPSLATLAPGAGNPAVSYRKYCRRGYYKHKGICVKKKHRHHRRHKKGRRR